VVVLVLVGSIVLLRPRSRDGRADIDAPDAPL
jgi:hypothetical protein